MDRILIPVEKNYFYISFAVLILLGTVFAERSFGGVGMVLTTLTSNSASNSLTIPVAQLAHTINTSAINSIRLGNLYTQQRNYAAAEAILGEAIVNHPNEQGARYALAQTLLVQGKYHEAAARASEEIEKFPAFIKAYYSRGLAYSYQGYWDLAINDFQHFINNTPFAPWPRIDLSWGFLSTGNPSKAQQLLEEVLVHDPGNVWALSNIGLAYIHQMNYVQAAASFDEALVQLVQLSPDQFLIAYPEQTAQQFPSSQKALEAGIWFNKGVLAEKMERPDDAIAAYNQAISLSQNGSVGDVRVEIIKKHIAELQLSSL